MSNCPNIVAIQVIEPAPEIVAVEVIEPTPDIVALQIVQYLSSGGGPIPLQFTATAAEVLSSNCFVTVNSSGLLIRASGPLSIPALGFVAASTVIGAVATVITGGIANGFTGLTPGLPIYLGASGQATQTPSNTGINQELGSALSPSKISIEIQPLVDLI